MNLIEFQAAVLKRDQAAYGVVGSIEAAMFCCELENVDFPCIETVRAALETYRQADAEVTKVRA